MEKYADDFVCSFETLRLRRRNPRVLLAFFTAWPMWRFQDILDWSSTPRYRLESSIWRVWPFREYDEEIGFFALVTLIALHFSGWNAIPHFFSHAARLLTVVQLDVNSRVQHPVALFLHPVALFVSCYAPCPFCLVVPFINVGIPHIVD